jgi:hypothetical protein
MYHASLPAEALLNANRSQTKAVLLGLSAADLSKFFKFFRTQKKELKM